MHAVHHLIINACTPLPNTHTHKKSHRVLQESCGFILGGLCQELKQAGCQLVAASSGPDTQQCKRTHSPTKHRMSQQHNLFPPGSVNKGGVLERGARSSNKLACRAGASLIRSCQQHSKCTHLTSCSRSSRVNQPTYPRPPQNKTPSPPTSTNTNPSATNSQTTHTTQHKP